MEFSPLALIGISLVAMFFGYFFGLLEGRGQGYKKRKKEEASEPSAARAATPAIPVTPAPAPSPTPPVAMPAPDNSVLKLSLDARQQPVLDMDGQRIDTNKIAPE